jgi:carbonic anhydrase
MPLPLSAGDMTRIRRLERVTKVVPSAPFSFFRSLPNIQTTSTFVLACIDPRFAYALEEYLDQTYAQNGSSYDLFILAGASMGGNLTNNTSTPPGEASTVPACAIVSSGNNWQVTLHNHIQVAITLHNVKQVVIIDHLNCGAYVACDGADPGPNGDQDRQLHENQFDDLKAHIEGEDFFPNGGGAAVAGSTIFTGGIIGYYFDGVAADNSTNMRNIADGSLRTPPVTESKGTNSGAKVLVLGCIDPRYSAVMTSFLTQYKGVQFIYDLFILAGASLGANQSYTTFPTKRGITSRGSYPNNVLADDTAGIGNLGRSWGPTFFDHLSVARLLHQVTEVWVFDHLDCGAYKLILSGNPLATDDSNGPHIIEMEKLRTNINTYTDGIDPLNISPYSLSFKGFIIGKDGRIENVIKDETGIDIDPALFGSSRIRNPASTHTDLMAFRRADYITQVQPLDMFENKNRIGLSQQKLTQLCNCSTDTTHLPKAPTLPSAANEHLRIL